MASVLPWPLVAIDFEASSLEQDGYPIEVGLALWSGPGAAVLGWSALIHPDWRWTRNGHWSAASARVHGLRREELMVDGLPPAQLAAALDAALGRGTVAWCDGGAYDDYWLRTLFVAGGRLPCFTLGSWRQLVEQLGPGALDRASAWLARTPARHRASADAERLLLAFAHAAGMATSCGGDLVQLLPALGAVPGSTSPAQPMQGPER